MIDDIIRPYPGEDEVSFTKRKAYYYRIGQPSLIEANFSGVELDFHQLCNGPIFGDLTEEVLKDVFENSYTLKSIIKSLS